MDRHQKKKLEALARKATHFMDTANRRLEADYEDYKQKVRALQESIDHLDRLAGSFKPFHVIRGAR